MIEAAFIMLLIVGAVWFYGTLLVGAVSSLVKPKPTKTTTPLPQSDYDPWMSEGR